MWTLATGSAFGEGNKMNKNAVGKLILIGINYYDNNNELLEQYETSGIIESITEKKIKIKRENSKELFTIPNDDRAIMEAKPGEYREIQKSYNKGSWVTATLRCRKENHESI